MHGFSIYLGKPINKTYIRQMVDLGYSTIFTSVQIPEEDESTKYSYLGELLDYLSNDSLTYMIDINPSLLNRSFFQFLKQYTSAAFIIRIDHSTSIEIIREIVDNGFQCCLNASILSESLLCQLKAQLNDFQRLCYCHNYYPRPDTGLTASYVNSQNRLILKYNHNADIYGFIVGTTKRGPLYKGLPTIEATRDIHPIVSGQLLLDHHTQHVLIGDPYFEAEQAQKLIAALRDRHFKLAIDLYDQQCEYILQYQHTVRVDNPEHVIRSQESRHYCQFSLQPNYIRMRTYGDITIDNQLNGRYQGELQLIKQPLPQHPHVNIVGHVETHDLPLLECLRPNDTFEFNIISRS
ncbi:MupG family TIM beta-alpha barrel fold protein [Staphylococcus caeli]|uniref:Outer surface protein n=1 Tax=Staphylococcus caeli TaxID=2201815 RepID=A0A1D4K9V5_9STAP|nr:MupG family TIM beta-alpha barrel fold protein [Staphylococcus caeli]SCS70684.1 outer surface protein [Staphylococcus caeli]SCS78060.1 outer surface protein [Staphylococcus caeli]